MGEHHHLVKDAAQTPDIRLLVVHLALPDLGRHYIGRPYLGLGHLECLAHELGDPKVANLKLFLASDKDVLAFEVPVQDTAVVDELEA